ncbi:MAG: flagellar basal body-associated FliL family protein [Defluviitaleaceae bacterium]|nr:flagellar basal body-associated FliL family protein [Defluviitaleaceae bacterium]
MEKGKPMMMIVLILLVVLLGAVGAVSFYALRLAKANQAGADTGANAPAAPSIQRLSIDQITKVPLTTVSTNLRVSADGSQNYIKLTIQVGVNNTVKKESDAIIKSLGDNEAVALDVVNGVLRNKTREELADPGMDTFQNLKNEITEKLQSAFNTNLIVDVYVVEIAYA